MTLVYCDSSALVKLVVEEPESDALQCWLLGQPDLVLVSSAVARTEVIRAVRRVDVDATADALELLESVAVVQLDPPVADAAGRLDPASLRSPDALHLASALGVQQVRAAG